MKFDVIRAVEACYAPAWDDNRWLAGLLETLGPLDEGLGLGFVAFIFRFAPGGSRVIESKVAASSTFLANGPLEADWIQGYESMPADLARRHLAPTPPSLTP